MANSEFNELWKSFVNKKLEKYEVSKEFEDKYVLALENLTEDFDIVWKFISSQSSEVYEYNVTIENKYIDILCEIGFLTTDFEELWKYVTTCNGDIVPKRDSLCEEIYDDLLYDSVFARISSDRYLHHSYQCSNLFENSYSELIKVSLDDEIGSIIPAPTKSSKKNNVMKSEKSQNLKNLLNQRLKRLKLEEETVECTELDSLNTPIFTCKLCGFKSKRKRRLFITHVIPLHFKSNRKSEKLTKKRKPKIKVSIRSEINKKYICPKLNCDKVFNTRGNRKRHMLSKHRTSDLTQIRCSKCDKQFACRFNLTRHVLHYHRKTFHLKKCPLCDYATRRTCNFERHCARKHVGLLDEVGFHCCSKCEKVFSNINVLKNHEAKHQAIEIGYNCSLCKQIVCEGHVCQFKCDICHKIFKLIAVYQRHIKIHKKLKDILKYVEDTSDHEQLKYQLQMLSFN